MTSRAQRFLFAAQVALCVFLVAAVLIPVFLSSVPWPLLARDYLQANGVAESGAANLVSAIYLGYRAFDTLGETIVLLVAISGTIAIIAHGGAVLAQGYGLPASAAAEPARHLPHTTRTELLEVVTGKLGPVVLVFGVYVMMYGHLSPGGGFQGGVVIASGIVFLALGSRVGASNSLTSPENLARIESAAFALLLLAASSGIISGSGFFGNPLAGVGLTPVAFIITLNAIIGLKVGAGIGFMCIAMLGRGK